MKHWISEPVLYLQAGPVTLLDLAWYHDRVVQAECDLHSLHQPYGIAGNFWSAIYVSLYAKPLWHNMHEDACMSTIWAKCRR